MAASAFVIRRFVRSSAILLGGIGLALLCALPARAAKYAVLIASGSFPIDSPWRSAQLYAPATDVRLMASLLKYRYAFPDSHVWIVGLPDGFAGAECPSLGRWATADAIRNALNRLAAQLRPGDQAVVYYSGHGTQIIDTDADSLQDEALVPYDMDRAKTICVPHKWLRQWRASLPRGVRLTLIADTCYSRDLFAVPRSSPEPAPGQTPWPALGPEEMALDGGIEVEKSLPNDSLPPVSSAERPLHVVPPALPPAAVFSASKVDGTTYEERLPSTNGRDACPVSLYTWVLYRTLCWAPRGMTNGQLEAKLTEQTRNFARPIHPFLEADPGTKRLPAIATPVASAMEFHVESGSSGMLLDAGLLAGVRPGMVFAGAGRAGSGARLSVVECDWLTSSVRLMRGTLPAPSWVIYRGSGTTACALRRHRTGIKFLRRKFPVAKSVI